MIPGQEAKYSIKLNGSYYEAATAIGAMTFVEKAIKANMPFDCIELGTGRNVWRNPTSEETYWIEKVRQYI